MKKTLSLILSLLVVVVIAQPAKTDPYYVKSTDTVSKHPPACITRQIKQDSKGNVWLATWSGIVMYDGKVFTNFTLKRNLIPFHVFSVHEDKAGNIWVGTVRGGAYKYDGKNFTLYTTNDGLANDLIGCIMDDSKGNIWLGTDEGISVMDTANARGLGMNSTMMPIMGMDLPPKKGFTNYTSADNKLCGDRINAIIQDKSGKFWIATRSGVCCYDGKGFSHFTMEGGQPFTNVRSVMEDSKGKIWIGGQEGLYSYDPAVGEKSLTKHMSNFIGYIYEDKSGNIWVNAGETKGMSLYKYDGKTATNILTKNSDSDFQVFEITEDNKGNIWFGTMRGACRYDGKNFDYFRN